MYKIGQLKKSRKAIKLSAVMIFAIVIFAANPIIAYARESSNTGQAPRYYFEADYPYNQWGRPTTSNTAPQHTQNIRRDRHSAHLPPPHGNITGFFSGEFPTGQANPFAPRDNNNPNASRAAVVQEPVFALLPIDAGVNVRAEGTNTNGFSITHTPIAQVPANQTLNQQSQQSHHNRTTTVTPFNDGTIGRITIPALNNRTASVRSGISLVTLDNYVGHFPFTSQWDGNIALASHNRGIGSFFAGIWNLSYGDRIIYETTLGIRIFEVVNITQILETDLSNLNHSRENILTLVTCVYNRPELRWSVRAREVVS